MNKIFYLGLISLALGYTAKANATERTFTFEVTASGVMFHSALMQAANNANLAVETYQISDSNGQTVYIIIFTKSA